MRAPVFEFALEVDRQIAALSRQERGLRTGRGKRLIEELFPLSRFAMGMKFPGNAVEVEAHENDGPLDGTISWGGSPVRELGVEVTCVHSYEDALREELLWVTGSTPGTGPIYRNKRAGEIIATNALVPTAEQMSKLALAIIERFRKKCAKPYKKGTILLVAFDDPTFFGFDLWRQLFCAIEQHGGLTGWSGEVHIMNCGSGETQFAA